MELEAKPEIARAHATLASVVTALGDLPAAQQHTAVAQRLLEGLGLD